VRHSSPLSQTVESIDSKLTARERQQKTLINFIKQQHECPCTSVDFYRVGRVLGKGAFGKVHIAIQVLTKQLVAIKSINTEHFKDSGQSKKVMQEVMILKQTRHKNIVRLFEYFQTTKHVLIVIELSSGGDLLSYVRKRRQLKEDVAKSLFKQICEAIQYCHSKRILHRDIKLDNILLTI
jgi:serine/threonine protein kinase